MSIQAILYRKGAEIVTIAPGASVATAAEKLRQFKISALVVKEGESVLGVISEREIVTALARHGDRIGTLTAGDIAARDVPTISPDDGLKRTMALMTRRHARHLLVLRGSKLAGIVSAGDVLEHRLEDLETEHRFLSNPVPYRPFEQQPGREACNA